MEITLTPQHFYDQRCSLVDILGCLRAEGFPEGLGAPFLEEALLLRFPEYAENIQRRIEFYKRKADGSLETYLERLIFMERYFYDRQRKHVFNQEAE